MEEIGQRRPALVAGAALAVAAVACAWAWPFAIDDAFIGVRYARHVAAGHGYVWNVGGAATDGVTPLPWAFLLVPLASAAPVVVLARAKLAGALIWMAAATAWGHAVGRAKAPFWVKWAAIGLFAIQIPTAAHCVSGMETAIATALITIASIKHEKPRTAAALAGLAAALRPELLVWSVVAGMGFASVQPARRFGQIAAAGGFASLPFIACAGVRGVAFGRLAPLSVFAKPSDFAHGLAYAGAAALFTLAPIVLASPLALLRERGPAFVLALAALAHFVVVVAVGGDWMPYARLLVPIIPSMLYAFVVAAPHERHLCTAIRVMVAFVLGLYWLPNNIRVLRRAGIERRAMIVSAAPLLASSRCVAAVDIGWVSAVFEGTIVDLAGVTDPEVAALPGGHTSKRIDAPFLLAHDPDTVLFYSDNLPKHLGEVSSASFPRVVEARLARSDLFTKKFEPAAFVRLGTKGTGYVLFQRR